MVKRSTYSHSKVDPFLALHLQDRDREEHIRMEKSGIYAFEEIEPIKESIVDVIIKLNGDINPLASHYKDLIVRSIVDNIATIEAPVSVVKALVDEPSIIYMEASAPLSLELDKTIPDIRVDQVRKNFALKGKGVIIGIIDTGIDFTHPDFRNPDGSSRILYIWDQNQPTIDLPPGVLGKIPDPPINYGREYTKNDINAALKSAASPYLQVPQKDENGHGTHVAGIAAGNGRASNGKYVGIAPYADIILVKHWNKERLGDSNTMIQALQYIFDKADQLDRPVVVNISLGNQLGPHDGTSLAELYVDRLLMNKHGRAIVKSAGNNGSNAIHGQGIVQQDGICNLKFSISPGDRDDDLISLWYDPSDQFELTMTAPNGETTESVKLMENKHLILANGNVVEIAHMEKDKDGLTNSAIVVLKNGTADTIQEGIWSINISGRKVLNGKFDSWIERLESGIVAPRFIGEYTNQKTISLPATSHYIITVGNYDSEFGRICSDSSMGPTRDGRLKPELVCPGTNITSAASNQLYNNASKMYTSMTGTSMSAPTATGVIALMFEKQPNLTVPMIKTILSTSARKDSYTGILPNNICGYGKIDAYSAVNQLPFTEATPVYVGSGLGIEMSSGCSFTKSYVKHDFQSMIISGNVILFASPDNSFQAIHDALDDIGDGNEIFIAMYDFSVDYVADLIKNVTDKGAKVKLMIDKDHRTGSEKSEQKIIQSLRNSGVSFVWSPSCNNDNISEFANCHEKIFIVCTIDGNNNLLPKKVMISSGNWSPGGIPNNIWVKNGSKYTKIQGTFKNGNREWGIIIENEQIARQYYDVLNQDFEDSRGAVASGHVLPEEEFATNEFLEDVYEENHAEEDIQQIHVPPLTISLNNTKLIPLFSPDNYQNVVTQLIDSAKKSVRIQQQTINPNGKHGDVNYIVNSLIKSKTDNNNLIIKFMRSSKWMKTNDANALQQLRAADCEIKFHNPKQYDHLHNKGIIIDDDIVVITSTNFTDTSIEENRECGIVIYSTDVADYFSKLFDLDWKNGLEEPLAVPTEIVTESDPRIKWNTYHRISLADVYEV
jgi:subtilisin family serine protease/phosphatidylserine/phosphatidylglycerophosphate/cardiolipin synthase-like enzyme